MVQRPRAPPTRFAGAPASGGGVGVGVCLVQTAVLHHYGTAAERSDVGVVGDDDHGGTVVPRGGHENAHDLAAGGLVERAGRLVGEDHGRFDGECTGDGDALHLSAAHLPRPVRGERAQSHAFQPQDRRVGGGAVGHAVKHHRQGDVFDRRQFGQQLAGLEDEAEVVAAQFGALGVAHAAQVGTTEDDGAGGRLNDAGERVQQSGFAGAGRAHHGYCLTLPEREVHVVQGERVHGRHGEAGLGWLGWLAGLNGTRSGRSGIRRRITGSRAGWYHAGDAVPGLCAGHAGGVVHDQVMGLDDRGPLLGVRCRLLELLGLLRLLRLSRRSRRRLRLLQLRCCCIHTPERTERTPSRPSGCGMNLSGLPARSSSARIRDTQSTRQSIYQMFIAREDEEQWKTGSGAGTT